MTSVLEAARKRLAEKEAQPKRPAKPPRPEVDVSELSPYQAAKRIAAAAKDKGE